MSVESLVPIVAISLMPCIKKRTRSRTFALGADGWLKHGEMHDDPSDVVEGKGGGYASPWAKPDESEFAPLFRDAAQYRAEHDRESFEHELAPSVMEYLTEKYDWEPEPISRIRGEKLALYVKRYIQFCEELGVRAIQGSAIWVAAFLDELREDGLTGSPHDVRGNFPRAFLIGSR